MLSMEPKLFVPRDACRPAMELPSGVPQPPTHAHGCLKSGEGWGNRGLACQCCPWYTHTWPYHNSTQTQPQLCSKIGVGAGSRERPGSRSRHLWACRGRGAFWDPESAGMSRSAAATRKAGLLHHQLGSSSCLFLALAGSMECTALVAPPSLQPVSLQWQLQRACCCHQYKCIFVF